MCELEEGEEEVVVRVRLQSFSNFIETYLVYAGGGGGGGVGVSCRLFYTLAK